MDAMWLVIVNVAAILLSPIIALIISLYLQRSNHARMDKIHLFMVLVASRGNRMTQEHVRALNMLDAVFHKNKQVRKIWREYYELLHQPAPADSSLIQKWNDKLVELIQEIAKDLGYSNYLRNMDMQRVYSPIWAGNRDAQVQDIMDELVRFLRTFRSITTNTIDPLDAAQEHLNASEPKEE